MFVLTMFMCTEYVPKIKVFLVFLILNLNLVFINKVWILRESGWEEGRTAEGEMRVEDRGREESEGEDQGRKGEREMRCMRVGDRGREEDV